MKKITLLLVALCLLLTACEKDPKYDWSRFYGFTAADVNGHYEATPIESLYQEQPTEGIVVYNNVKIDITASDDIVLMHIVIPDVLNRSFSGHIDLNDPYRSDLILYNGNNNEDALFSIYKSTTNGVRFSGRVKHYYYNSGGQVVKNDYYGFDVTKE